MNDISNLASQIDAEFSAVAERTKKYQVEQMHGHLERQKRMERLAQAFEELREVWRPRLEFLQKKFGDRVKATPRIVPATARGDVRVPVAPGQSHVEIRRLHRPRRAEGDPEL